MHKSRTVYLNHDYLPIEQATVSVMDRGFLFGDSVYDVIPVYHFKPFALNEHLARLQRSIAAIGIRFRQQEPDWLTIVQKLVSLNQNLGPNQKVYIQVTRGSEPQRQHTYSDIIEPTVFIQTTALPTPDPMTISNGVHAITSEDTRWKHNHIKANALLANVLLSQEAKERHASEAILIRDGYVVEGASSNVFTVKDDVIYTPPLSDYLLGGITRDFVIRTARENNFRLLEKPITLPQLVNSDEIWITSSTRDIYAITRLNNRKIGNGKPGKVWQSMMSLFQQHKPAPAS